MIKEWPVPQSVEGVLGTVNGELDAAYIRGLLPKLMTPVDSTVIFAYREETSEDMLFIDVFREEPLKSLRKEFHGVCAYLRKKYGENDDWYKNICSPNDTQAMEYVYSLYGCGNVTTQKPNGWEALFERDGLTLYKYKCKETCFIEFIVPVIVNFGQKGEVNNKIIGAFITGMFKPPNDELNLQETCDAIISVRKTSNNYVESEEKELKNELEKVFINNRTVPSAENLDIFMGNVVEFSNAIETRYTELLLSSSLRLQHIMDEYIWDDEKNSEDNISGIEDFEQRLSKLNERLLKGLNQIINDNESGFSRIHISTPTQNIEQYDMMLKHSPDDIFSGAWVGIQSQSNLWIPEIKCSTEYWDSIVKGNTRRKMLLKILALDNYNNNEVSFLYELEMIYPGIKEYIESGNIEFESLSVYIFSTQRHPEFPLVFLVNDIHPRKKCNKDIIREILESVAEKYLTQWNEIYSDRHRFLVEVSAGYIDHELGQIQSGIESLANEAKDSYEPVWELLKPIIEKGNTNKEIKDIIFKTKDFAKDILTFNNLIELISKHQLSSIFSSEPNQIDFWAYGDVLYGLNEIYESQCVLDGKHVDIPSREELQRFDKYSSKIFTDKNIFMIIANNLIRNAVKYSWTSSLIYIDCWLDKRRKAWILEVINYGRDIKSNEVDDIFDFKIRGSNAEKTLGMGIGLYLVKHLTKNLLNGDVEFEYTQKSEKCVPALMYFASVHFQKQLRKYMSEERFNICREAYNEVVRNGDYNRIVNAKAPVEDLTWHEIDGMIDIPTYEYKFTVEIPLTKKEEQK
jgi:signal transduction histidine kinase